MAKSTVAPLVLEEVHTGERLELVRRNGVAGEELVLNGVIPPHRAGTPVHAHLREEEEVTVLKGTLSTLLQGQRIEVGPGETLRVPRGAEHRWWNQGDEAVEFRATVRPAVDLDRYLQAVFQVNAAGPQGKPPLLHMAHVVVRHGGTQRVRILPGFIQGPFWVGLRILGTVLGKYRGNDWPGAPQRCSGAPVEGDPRD